MENGKKLHRVTQRRHRGSQRKKVGMRIEGRPKSQNPNSKFQEKSYTEFHKGDTEVHKGKNGTQIYMDKEEVDVSKKCHKDSKIQSFAKND